jgi:hypothetical protein
MANDWTKKTKLLPPIVTQPNTPNAMRNVPSTWWFSSLSPVGPSTPSGFRPRQYPTLPGQNIIWQPRAQDAISFETLRALAETWDLLRMVIETKKSQICAQAYELRAKAKPNEKNKDRKERAASDPMLRELNAFFAYPDGIHPFKRWLNMWLEDELVIDAVALWMQRDSKGRIAAVTPLAGDTINRMVNDQGVTPRPDPNWKRADNGLITPRGSVAYQEVLYGTVAYEFTTDDMLYSMRNERTWKQYGFSRVEQALLTISLGLRRFDSQIQWYTSGNTPEAMVFLPPSMDIDQVKEIQDWFDTVNAGDMAQRRRIRFMPGGGEGETARPNVVFTKEAVLKDELDVWLAQCICYDFGVSAQPFLKMMNRASAQEASETSEEIGLKPDVDYVVEVLNQIITLMGFGDEYEWAAQAHREVDVLKAAQADNLLAGKIVAVNEIREVRGLDPVPIKEADMLGAYSPQFGFIPLEGSADAATAQRQKALEAPPSGSEQSSDGKAQPKGKSSVSSKPNGKGSDFTADEKKQAKKAMLVNRTDGGYSAFGSLRS